QCLGGPPQRGSAPPVRGSVSAAHREGAGTGEVPPQRTVAELVSTACKRCRFPVLSRLIVPATQIDLFAVLLYNPGPASSRHTPCAVACGHAAAAHGVCLLRSTHGIAPR